MLTLLKRLDTRYHTIYDQHGQRPVATLTDRRIYAPNTEPRWTLHDTTGKLLGQGWLSVTRTRLGRLLGEPVAAQVVTFDDAVPVALPSLLEGTLDRLAREVCGWTAGAPFPAFTVRTWLDEELNANR